MAVPAAKTSRMRQRKLNLKQPLQIVREDDLESFEANETSLKEIQTGVEAHEEQEHHLQAVISAAQAAAAGGTAAKASIPTRGTDASNLPYDDYYHLKFAQPATYIRFSSTVEDCMTGAPYDMVEEDDDFLRSLNEKLRLQAQQASARPTSRSAAAAIDSIPQNCNESQFEADMAAFEAAAKAAAPFSSSLTGDQTAPIVTVEEQLAQLSINLPEDHNASSSTSSRSHALLRALAAEIYPHWHARRVLTENTPLTPLLKVKVLETGDALDDNDPYVCFRRREVRAVRKTRGRDAQSSEKLRLLRRQLEDARQLLQTVLTREKARKDVLTMDKTLFEARTRLRGVKRTLPSQYQDGDEDLLVNQKPTEGTPATVKKAAISVTGAASTLSNPVPAGPEMQLLEEWYEARKRHQLAEIINKVHQHKQWNNGFIDDTTVPVKPPPPDDGIVGGFRAARAEYLPTPPASSADGESPVRRDTLASALGDRDDAADQMQIDGQGTRGDMTASLLADKTSGETTPASWPRKTGEILKRGDKDPQMINVRYMSPDPPPGAAPGRSPSFRRRVGRGGRMWIDRRNMPRLVTPEESDSDDGTSLTPLIKDRFKFDHDSDDDADEDPNHVFKYSVDPYDWRSMLLRAQNSPVSHSNAMGHGAHGAALAQQHAQQLQRQKQLQMQQAQNHAAGQAQASQLTPQTLRQQVAAAQQQAAAQAATTITEANGTAQK